MAIFDFTLSKKNHAHFGVWNVFSYYVVQKAPARLVLRGVVKEYCCPAAGAACGPIHYAIALRSARHDLEGKIHFVRFRNTWHDPYVNIICVF